MLRFDFGTRVRLLVTSRAFVNANIYIVGATREGIFKFKHSVLNQQLRITQRFEIPDIPIWVTIIDADDTINRGDVWAQVQLEINGDIMHALISGYVFSVKPMAWPKTNLQIPQPLESKIIEVSSLTQGAGNENNIQVAEGEIWKVRALEVALTTSATVANRRVHLQMQSPILGVYDFISSVDQTASTTKKYTFTPLGTALALSDDNDIIVPITPDITVDQDWNFQTSTTNLQAGDTFGTLFAMIERYIDLEAQN